MTEDYRVQFHYICGHKNIYKYGYVDIEKVIGEEFYCPDCNDSIRVIRIIILDNQYAGHMWSNKKNVNNIKGTESESDKGQKL